MAKLAKRVAVQVQTWTKKYSTTYDKNVVAKLVITPRRSDYLLLSLLSIGAKQAHKPEAFVETREQVELRRKGLAKDGFVLTVKTIHVHEAEAPPAWER